MSGTCLVHLATRAFCAVSMMSFLRGSAPPAFEAQNAASARLHPNVEFLRLRIHDRRRRLISQIQQLSPSSRKGTIEAPPLPLAPNQQMLERIIPQQQRLCTRSLPAPSLPPQITTYRRSSRRPRFVRPEPSRERQQQASNEPSDGPASSPSSSDFSSAPSSSSLSSSSSRSNADVDDDGTALLVFGRHRMVVMAAALMQPLSIPEPSWQGMLGSSASPATHARPASAPAPSSSDVWVCVHQERPDPSCPAHCYVLSSLPHAGGTTGWPSSTQTGAEREGWPSLASASISTNGLRRGNSGSSSGGSNDVGSSSMQELLSGLAHVMPPAVSLTGHTFSQCRNRAGPWSCYRLHVAEGAYGADEADVLFPNRVVLIDGEDEAERDSGGSAPVMLDASAFCLPCSPYRSLYNAGSPELLCAWLSDPTPEKLTAHLTNLVTLPLRRQSLRAAAAPSLPRPALKGAAAESSAVTPSLLSSSDLDCPEALVAPAASSAADSPAAAATSSRGSAGSTRLASGDWCYSRLQQTWGAAALSQLGYTKRHVAGLILKLQDECRAAAAAGATQGGVSWAKAG